MLESHGIVALWSFPGITMISIVCNLLLAGWNMLFFLWGVFWGRRSNSSDSLKKSVVPSLNVVPLDKEIPSAVISLSENLGLPESIDRETSAFDSSCDVAIALNAPAKPYISFNGDFDNKAFSLQTNSEKQDSRLDSKSLPKIATSSVLLCPEIRCASPSLVMFFALCMYSLRNNSHVHKMLLQLKKIAD